MNTQEAAALLAIAASFDNRRPDPDAAKAWSVALTGYRFEDCRDAIVAHYAKSTDWLMPAHVIAAVRIIRNKRIAEAPAPTPPPGLTPGESCAYLMEQRRRIGDGEDGATYPGELKPRVLSELRALMPKVDKPTTTEESA